MKIEHLYTYPIKSCRGQKVSESNIQITGLEYDRIFAVINAQNEIITARENPDFFKINPKIEEDKLILTTDKNESISIELNTKNSSSINIKLFTDSVTAITVSEKADQWLSNVMRENCRLVATNSKQLRKVKSKYNKQQNAYLSFGDLAPIHLISEESLNDLNSKLETKVTLEHFRPNIVVSGLLAYEEDNWSSVKIGSCEFDVILKTPRCNMTTIDPITTKVDGRQEPLRTLSRYRKTGNKINFGIYLIPKNTGPISITDEITYRRNQVIANKNNP